MAKLTRSKSKLKVIMEFPVGFQISSALFYRKAENQSTILNAVEKTICVALAAFAVFVDLFLNILEVMGLPINERLNAWSGRVQAEDAPQQASSEVGS